jgi:hypothetical protein
MGRRPFVCSVRTENTWELEKWDGLRNDQTEATEPFHGKISSRFGLVLLPMLVAGIATKFIGKVCAVRKVADIRLSTSSSDPHCEAMARAGVAENPIDSDCRLNLKGRYSSEY